MLYFLYEHPSVKIATPRQLVNNVSRREFVVIKYLKFKFRSKSRPLRMNRSIVKLSLCTSREGVVPL